MINFSGLNILVVEDHEFQRRAICRTIGNLGAVKILDVPDAPSGLSVVENDMTPIDICVVDLKMPRMDGMESIRHLAESKR